MSLGTMLDKMRETGKAMARNSFIAEEDLKRLPQMSRQELDELPFGAVKVDDQGQILIYNRGEGEIAGFAPREVEGKNFFTQLAVCTNNDIFFGSFRKGVAENDLNLLFNYTFTYKIAPLNVRVHLYRDPDTRSNFVLVSKN